jgi:hypothetical protein
MNTANMIDPTLIQFAAAVIVLKSSGYNQSVDGQGKQQLTPKLFEQNRPSMTANCQHPNEASLLGGVESMS